MFLLFLIGCFVRTSDAIHEYEWFHEAYNRIEARISQIKSHKELISKESDQNEIRMLRIELSGMQQSCRELIADYNSNSDKVNVGIFQGSSLPNHMEIESCE